MRSPLKRRRWPALAALAALAACADLEPRAALVPLGAIEPGAGPIELGEGVDDAPRAIMSAVIAGDLLVGGQAASRMLRGQAASPAAGPPADGPIIVTGDPAGLEERRQEAFARMTAEHRQARLRQAEQDLLLESWMRTRVGAPPLPRDDIRRAQQLLAQLGFDPGPIDGFFGPRTRTAVERFEQAQGLPVSGEISPALIDRLALET